MPVMSDQVVTVIGAGSPAARPPGSSRGADVRVRFIEMRPVRMTEAHQTAISPSWCARIRCAAPRLETAVGVLKEEMRRLGSLVIAAADQRAGSRGSALAVDREDFSRRHHRDAQSTHPLIEVVREEVIAIPDGRPSSRPARSPARRSASSSTQLIGPRNLYFYDAIAPIVAVDSIDMDIAFLASRYGKGGDDYINCPMTEAEYDALHRRVIAAEKIALHPFEKPVYFEGCMPIEEMARRGPQDARVRADAAGRARRSAHAGSGRSRWCSCARTIARAASTTSSAFKPR